MNTNFFTADIGFQKSLIDTSSNIGSRKDYTTSLKKDEFKTSRTSEIKARNDVEESEQNKKFNDIMKSLKSKESAKSDETSSEPPNEAVLNKDLRAKIMVQNTKLEVFSTQQSAVSADDIALELLVADTGDASVDLINIAAINAEIQKLISEQAQNTDDSEGQITVSVAENTKDIPSILSLISTLLSDEEARVESSDKLTLTEVIEQIKTVLESEDSPAIITGLSPEQLTQLQDNIEKFFNNKLDKRETEELEKLIAQFVVLTPPAEQKQVKNVDQLILSIVPEKSQAPTPRESLIKDRFDARYDNSEKPILSDVKSNQGEFKTALKDAGLSPNTASPSNDNTNSAGQSFLQASKLENIGQILNPQSQISPLLSATQATQSPLQSSLTNVITQSQSAGSSHPATQLVSTTIQKAVKAGENTNIKIKLDPPELGRVEVKMSIDKDNTTRIVLTAEKPETYLLLKQDADILQRALNDAGLDTDGNISFELADGEHDFGNGDRRGNDGKQAGGGSDDSDDNLIETTMDWQVDPDTGRMRYNVMV